MPKATVLLSKGLDKDGQVVEVRGMPFYRSKITGIANSIQAAQQAGLRAPSYLLAEGRIAAGQDAQARGNIQLALEEPVWDNWYETLAETDTFVLEQNYRHSRLGRYVVDIQNGAIFSHDHQRIRNSVLGQKGLHLQQGAVQLTRHDADLLFGEGIVYGWEDGEMKLINLDYAFASGDEFLEASADPHFLRSGKPERFGLPVYAVIRRGGEADREPSGFHSIDAQRRNTGLAIRCGGRWQTDQLLDVAQRLGWAELGSYHNNYHNANGGSVVTVDISGSAIYGGCYRLDSSGHSVAVAPGALVQRTQIVQPLPLEAFLEREERHQS